MNREQQLAEAAISGHWPPHLLAPDEDKVYVLGQALENASNREDYIEELEERVKTFEAEQETLEYEVGQLKKRLSDIQKLASE